MNERIARGAARVAELDDQPVDEAEDRRPHAERDAESKQRPQHGLAPARPGELYKAGMFSLLAAVQLAWLAAIAYGIFLVLH
jgi:hypothetical protein